MAVVTMKQLLEAGVHFGHQAKRWNPKMAKYIFTERNGIHVIDLHKSLKKIEEAYSILRGIAADGGSVLFVGTKKQAQDSIREQAERAGMYYINNRWLGGMLTNFETIKARIERLKMLETMDKDGTLDDSYTKKEAAQLRKELAKLSKNLSGIKNMKKLPAAIFVVDVKKEALAITEAVKLGIPVIAMVDSNVDPEPITYPIPANDDAIRSVKLMSTIVANAVIEGNQGAEAERAKAAEKTVIEEGSAE
ncbi:30S ribosomal protein S2 [Ilyobacter polytropus]|uniref:Small ribosomal subunit protein uS2 n=1 Tax=Ilyobacter polytropus (strain ATCC 51220 / DSM 2926 / LMG 16218 / CuHBu1) TaxID=572544 RepID=E3H8Z5_ILYPC|nr:30S ribosomal protein S2 [Ilyobacter polytropus]ADO83549.1 SSU ribosomal protein S2P [Ilyobacter polytropus DSM 2926]